MIPSRVYLPTGAKWTCAAHIQRAVDLQRTLLARCHLPASGPCISDRRSVLPAVLQFALFMPQSFVLACFCPPTLSQPSEPFSSPSNLALPSPPPPSPPVFLLLAFILTGIPLQVHFLLAHGEGVRDPTTRLLVVMARAEEQPGPAHWPCGLSHSPLLLMLAPICTERSVQTGLRSCLSAYCCCLPAPSCVKALHGGHSCRLLKLLASSKLVWVTHAISLMPKTTKCAVARSKLRIMSVLASVHPVCPYLQLPWSPMPFRWFMLERAPKPSFFFFFRVAKGYSGKRE